MNEKNNAILMTLVGAVAKIFLTTFFLSFVLFLFAFSFGFPLVFEHRLISTRFAWSYFVNFLSGMSLYILFAAVGSVLIYFCVKGMSVVGKIFFITLATAFWGFLGGLAITGLYYGNRGDPPWIIMIWGVLKTQGKNEYLFSIVLLIAFAVSVIIAGISVVSYKVYHLVRK
jgi:hypothetical protein